MTNTPERIADYRIERQLAGHGFESRYRAVHMVLPRKAIVRVAPREAAVRMMREACMLEALRHPGVPRVYECGVLVDQRPWIAVEYVEGASLAQTARSAPLTAHEVVAFLHGVAEILDHAHRRGIAHGGVSTEAIVRGDGTRGFPLCLVGWDAARLDEGAVADDVAALGVAAYEALTLAAPTMPLARRCPTAPPRLIALVDHMLAPDRAARPTAPAVAAEADRLAGLSDLVLADETVSEAEEVQLLVDLSRDPVPAQPARAPRWSPGGGDAARQRLGSQAEPPPGAVLAQIKPERRRRD